MRKFECLVLLLLASLAINLLGLALPLVLLQVYDRIIPNSASSTLAVLTLACGGAILLEAILRIARSSLTTWLGSRFEREMSAAGFERLLSIKLDEISRRGSGAYVEALNAARSVKDFYSGQAILGIIDLPFIALYVGIVWVLAGEMVLAPLAAMALLVLATLAIGLRLRHALSRKIESEERRLNFVIEVLSGIHAVKGIGMEATMLRRHERLQEQNAEHEHDVARLGGAITSMSMTFAQAMVLVMAAAGSLEVIAGAMTVGTLSACTMLAGRIAQPTQSVLERLTRYQATRLAIRRFEELLGARHAPAAGQGAIETWPEGGPTGRITLDAVTVRFGNEGRAVLSDIDLEVEAGEIVGILGSNASGKSTLLHVIAGFVPVARGAVGIDGADVARLGHDGLRGTVVYVPEEPFLFGGTILQNLTMFDRSRTDGAMDACRLLGIDRRIASMPLGFDTIVGETAQEALPRGLRQMLAIARALAADARVLLLDEANSSVDGAADHALRAALLSLRGRCTVILVSQRPSLLAIADRVLRLDGGRLLPGTAEPPTASTATLPAPPDAEYAIPVEAPPLEHVLGTTVTPSPWSRCLVRLLRALGWPGSARALGEAIPYLRTSLDEIDLRTAMVNLGFTVEHRKASLETLDPSDLPCLFVRADGAPFVLVERVEDGIDAYEGRTGQSVVLHGGHGRLLAFAASERRGARPQQQSWFLQTVGRMAPLAWTLLGISFVTAVLSLSAPLFIAAIYDKVIATRSVSTLGTIAVGALIVVAGDLALRQLRVRAMAWLGGRLSFLISNASFDRILQLPVGLTERANLGTQISRLKDLDTIRDFASAHILGVLIDLPFSLAFLIAIGLIAGPVVAVPVVALLVMTGLVLALQPAARRRSQAAARAETRRQDFVVETILKLPGIRHCGAEETWNRRYASLVREATSASSRSAHMSQIIAAVCQSCTMASGLLAVAVGVQRVVSGAMSPGELIAVMMLVWRVLTPAQMALTLLPRIGQLRSSMRQIDGLMSLRTEQDGAPVSASRRRLRGAVTLSRVSLRYSQDADPALVGVSVEAEPGQLVALVGPDGAGKSTLLKVVAGLYMPQAGTVRIDDMDIRQMNLAELRRDIGYVPQKVQLFHGTIAQNLRLGQPTASEADLRFALALAGAAEEVAVLPDGLDTRIGDRQSVRLPSGLARKLMLARAYVGVPPVLLLDEPASGLDFDGDAVLMRALSWLRGKSTVFIATHRPSHVRLADQVIQLEAGMMRPAAANRQTLPLITKAGE